MPIGQFLSVYRDTLAELRDGLGVQIVSQGHMGIGDLMSLLKSPAPTGDRQ